MRPLLSLACLLVLTALVDAKPLQAPRPPQAPTPPAKAALCPAGCDCGCADGLPCICPTRAAPAGEGWVWGVPPGETERCWWRYKTAAVPTVSVHPVKFAPAPTFVQPIQFRQVFSQPAAANCGPRG